MKRIRRGVMKVGGWFARHRWPEVSGTIKVAGLLAPVEVIRDRWGVPHIYAQSAHDLVFAQGYVHAQDRLWEMEMTRRLTKGTISEVMGKAGLAADRWYVSQGVRGLEKQNWQELDDEGRTLLQDYAAGINTYIDTHRSRLPLEFTILRINPASWTPLDSLALGNVLEIQHSSNRQLESLMMKLTIQFNEQVARELITPPSFEDMPTIIPSDELGDYDWMKPADQLDSSAPQGTSDASLAATGVYGWAKDASFKELSESVNGPDDSYGAGSNVWAVHGTRTETGKPILANDLHLELVMPSLWYENGLHGGGFESVGFTLPGVPLVIIGHNQHITWAFASLHADVQDNYIEKLDDPDHPTRYEFMGKWYPVEVTHETIKVKGGESKTLDLYRTRHGLIIPHIRTWPTAPKVAVRWTMYEDNRTLKAIIQLNRARNWDEFRAALQYWDVPAMNFVYADTEGNVGFQVAGKLPDRVPGHTGALPVPGWTGEYEWQGFIPFDKLPYLFNPRQGFVVAAVNKVVSGAYPYKLAFDYFPGFRAKRITDLLAANASIAIKDMVNIQADTYSVLAEKLRPYLVTAIRPENSLQSAALEHVKAWDLNYAADSTAALIFETWYKFLVENVLARKLGKELFYEYTFRFNLLRTTPFIVNLMTDPNNSWFNDSSTPQVETRDDMVRRSFVDALDWLGKRCGNNLKGWTWGRLHTVTFTHMPLGASHIAPLEYLFNSSKMGVPGAQFTVNSEFWLWANPYKVILGPSQRMIVDLGDWDNVLAVNPPGQSGHLFNPHREDQIPLWLNMQFHPLLFTRAAVEKNTEATLTLTPQ